MAAQKNKTRSSKNEKYTKHTRIIKTIKSKPE